MKALLVWYGILAISLGIIGMVCMNTASCIDVNVAAHNMSLRTDLTSDPWMTQNTQEASSMILVAGSIGDLSQRTLDRYEVRNGVIIDVKGNHIIGPNTNPQWMWDNYLGGIPLAICDSSLKTSDPIYLEMGAQPMGSNSSPNLPQFLQEI